jgi:hypothetical protein
VVLFAIASPIFVFSWCEQQLIMKMGSMTLGRRAVDMFFENW